MFKYILYIFCFWILYNIYCYAFIKYKYKINFNNKENIILFLFSLITGKKIYYCRDPINKINSDLLSNNQRSFITEWKIGMHNYLENGILSVPSTNNYDQHNKSIKILTNLFKKQSIFLYEDKNIDKLIDKMISKNNIVKVENIVEFLTKTCDINNKFDENEIKEFSEIGYKVMKYAKSEMSVYSFLPFMLGYITEKRKKICKQYDNMYRKYIDKELFNLPNDIEPDKIDGETIVTSFFFYSGMLFTSINNLTVILFYMTKANNIRKNRLINDKLYRLNFINEIVRINNPAPTLARKVENFDVVFTNIYNINNFDWDFFDLNIEKESSFNIFGFGKRQCVAKGWIIKIYENFIISILSRYYIDLSNNNIKDIKITQEFAYTSNPVFKFKKI